MHQEVKMEELLAKNLERSGKKSSNEERIRRDGAEKDRGKWLKVIWNIELDCGFEEEMYE